MSEPDTCATFRYRLAGDLSGASFEKLMAVTCCFNSTPWKCHAPNTVQVAAMNYQRFDDGTAEFVTTFRFGSPFRYAEDKVFKVDNSIDFNEFEFGDLWEPDATLTSDDVEPPDMLTPTGRRDYAP